MSKFSDKGKAEMPELNTSSLPDLIFSILFFGILTDAGTFRPIIRKVIGMVGTDPVKIALGTAILAAIGGSVAAKRTALAHVIFNLSGTLVFIWFIPWYADFVRMISPAGAEIDIISRQIANAHLCFNVANTIIWLPMLGLLAKLVTKIIKGKDLDRLPSEPVFLDHNVLHQPFAAIMLVKKEMDRLA